MDADLCNRLLGDIAAGDLTALEKLYDLMQAVLMYMPTKLKSSFCRQIMIAKQRSKRLLKYRELWK